MNSTPTAPLTTERLRLDPLRTDDAAPMVDVLASPDLYRFTGGTAPSLADLGRRYAAQTAGSPEPDEQWFNWIVRTHDGSAAGFVQASITGGVGDVAWVIGAAAQGRGYAREAASAMCDWLQSIGVAELYAHIHPDHAASRVSPPPPDSSSPASATTRARTSGYVAAPARDGLGDGYVAVTTSPSSGVTRVAGSWW